MQKITTRSVMDTIGLSKNTFAGDESQFMRPTHIFYQNYWVFGTKVVC